MALSFNFEHDQYSNELLNEAIADILSSNVLMSMATNIEGRSYISTSFYAYNDKLDFYFVSPPDSHHSQYVLDNPSVALSIFDSSQKWDDAKQGLQLFGKCQRATGLDLIEAGRLCMKRFVSLKTAIPNLDDIAKTAMSKKFYKIEVDSLQLFDEKNLEKGLFLPLKIQR